MVSLLLEEKVAFVTGTVSKREIGHTVALKLAEDGANIPVSSRSRFSRSIEEIQAPVGKSIALVAHVEDYRQINLAAESAVKPRAIMINLRDEYFEQISKEKGIPVERVREEEDYKKAIQELI